MKSTMSKLFALVVTHSDQTYRLSVPQNVPKRLSKREVGYLLKTFQHPSTNVIEITFYLFCSRHKGLRS